MNRKTIALVTVLLTFTVGLAVAKLSTWTPQLPEGRGGYLQVRDYRLSGPYQHENLTIFLIHGLGQSASISFTPLQEAMERNLVIVHETGDVNELAIENVSAEEVFVQAGDIVKGGQQDRVLAVDLILPGHSGKLPIAAFCVEHSRWRQRGSEQADQFSISEQMVATKDLRLATKQQPSQSRVWDEVNSAQEKLSAGVASDVRSDLSESSLQLALENQKVQEQAVPYLNKLSSIVEGGDDVIGFAFSINGSLNSADIYPSNAMFKRFWNRLLKTAAIEAVGERTLHKEGDGVSLAAVGEFLTEAEMGMESLNEVTKRTHMIKREGERGLFFETRDMDRGGIWVHRNYLTQ